MCKYVKTTITSYFNIYSYKNVQKGRNMKKYKIITFLIAALESQFSGYNNNMQIILNETIQCNQPRIGIT